jgi:hypothetical protein
MKSQLEALFNNYIDAFESYSLDAARRCYALPCVLTTPDKMLVLTTEQGFSDEFNEIFSSLKQAGFKQVGWRSPSFHDYGNGLISVAIPWHFYNNQSQEFASFIGLYQVSNINNQLRIVSVTSHEQEVKFEQTLTLKTN